MIQDTKELKSSEFIPLNEFLLVKPKEMDTEEKSDFGIVLGQNKSITNRAGSGHVISVGRDIKDITSADYVLFPNTQGIDIEFSDGKFLLLRYTDIIGMKKH